MFDFSEAKVVLNLLRSHANYVSNLPAPYITINFHEGYSMLGLQLRSPADFEAWREALEIEESKIEMKTDGESHWLVAYDDDYTPEIRIRLSVHKIIVAHKEMS